MALHFFSDSSSLSEYLHKYDVIIWHGDMGLGTFTFIDNCNLHVIFDTRKDYEDWCSCGSPVQLSLF